MGNCLLQLQPPKAELVKASGLKPVSFHKALETPPGFFLLTLLPCIISLGASKVLPWSSFASLFIVKTDLIFTNFFWEGSAGQSQEQSPGTWYPRAGERFPGAMCWEPRLLQRYHLNCSLKWLARRPSCWDVPAGRGAVVSWLPRHRRASSRPAPLRGGLEEKEKKFTYFHNISDPFSKMAGEAIAVECSTALERR